MFAYLSKKVSFKFSHGPAFGPSFVYFESVADPYTLSGIDQHAKQHHVERGGLEPRERILGGRR